MTESSSIQDPAESDLSLLLGEVDQQIQDGEIAGADALLDDQSQADRLIVLSRLPEESYREFFRGISPEKAAEYLHDIPESQAQGLLENLDPGEAAVILQEMPCDEQADLVGELPTEKQESIFSEMDSNKVEEVRGLIEYDVDEAGGLMIVEFVAVPSHWTVGDVTTKLQTESSVYSDYDVQYIYVVREQPGAKPGKLVGVLRLRDLVMSSSRTSIEKLMIPEPIAVNDHSELKDLHQLFVEHQFLGVPVTDQDGNLVGLLRRSDVELAMADRYADAYMKSQGIVNEELRTMPLVTRSRRRLAWLSINIVLNLLAASVIALYQETLEQVIALAVFLPIISDMSGCSGNQAVAVSMRELSLGLIRPIEVGRVWLKEIGVGLINGLCLGILIGVIALIWKGNPYLGVVVGAAMMANTLIAVSLGGTMPLIIKRFGVDPALASGPILTTVTDMCGFFIVLSLAAALLERLT